MYEYPPESELDFESESYIEFEYPEPTLEDYVRSLIEGTQTPSEQLEREFDELNDDITFAELINL